MEYLYSQNGTSFPLKGTDLDKEIDEGFGEEEEEESSIPPAAQAFEENIATIAPLSDEDSDEGEVIIYYHV